MTTVVDATDLFVAALRGRHAPSNTIKAYASDLRRFAGAVPPDLAALDAVAIRAFLDGDAAGASMRRRRYAALCSFYRWLAHYNDSLENGPYRVNRSGRGTTIIGPVSYVKLLLPEKSSHSSGWSVSI